VLKTQAGVVAELPYKNLLLTGVYIVGFRLADLKKHKGWVGHLPCMCKILGSIPSTAKKKKKKLGTVAHTCNASYMRGGDWEDWRIAIQGQR
jgi:hypothetical protein